MTLDSVEYATLFVVIGYALAKGVCNFIPPALTSKIINKLKDAAEQ